jgi:predicted HAD superfamily hydrolase
MIVQSNHVFGAIAYTLTKGDSTVNYAKLDDATKAKYGALSPFFLSYIGNGDISRHTPAAVGKALLKNNPDLLKDAKTAAAVAAAFLDLATTITDNVY